MAKGFFTEGMFGLSWGKRGLFSKPSTVEFSWKVGDQSKANSKEEIRGKADNNDFKCDVKIKL